jgi:hypothetical protein
MKMVRSGRATSAIAGVTICAIQHGLSASIRHSLSATPTGLAWHTKLCAHPSRTWMGFLAQGRSGHATSLTEPCEKLVELRALLPTNSSGDPVDTLDKTRSSWRSELPFDMESGDMRAMVEQIVRVRDEATAALGTKRYLSRAGKNWQPRASLNLTGQVDVRRLPRSIVTAVKDGRRARVATLPPIRVDLCCRPGFRSPPVLGPHTD